ncbi:MAG: hypothetical protein ABR999_10890 [Methanoregula sp.]|jgi:hypothetical protein|uniref:hypothetical protein n=1 Tax=Methanoregula sp. TaxID=2052170 RepID=UPI003D118E9A
MTQPGPTLSDAANPQRRLRKLKESRANLIAIIQEKEDCLDIIDAEIADLDAALVSNIPESWIERAIWKARKWIRGC